MKSVLHVISTLEQGGTEAVVLNYFNNIDKKEVKFDFLVIWGEKKGYYEDYLLSEGCKVFRMHSAPNKYFAHGKELKEFFTGHNYDIVHIHSMSSLRCRVAKAAKKSGVNTVIYHSHNSSGETHLFLHKLFKSRLNKWCDYKFACSEAAGRFMYRGEFQIIRNAIDVMRFGYNEQQRCELRDKFNLNGKFVVGNIGRLTEVKNQQFILRVLKPLLQLRRDTVVFCIGEGSEKDKLLKYANDNYMSENVVFAGTVGTEVYKYYSLFDCIAFPSKFEGLSMVMIEAQANGLPIIASDKLSVEHKIAENFVFLPIEETEDNYEKWATAINNCGSRSVNDGMLAKAGYDIKIEADKLSDFYLSL